MTTSPPAAAPSLSLPLPLTSALLIGLYILAQTAVLMIGNDGHFVYALDDAYIHLDLADQLGRTGVYGVNPGIASSPSSSILWPFLLAPFAPFGIIAAIPFLIGLLASLLAGWIMPEFVRRILGPGLRPLTVTVISFLALLGLNLPGLTLCGMEHALHTVVCLLITLGVLRALENPAQAPAWWWWLAVILSPLLRYEGVFVSLGGLGILFWLGWRRSTALCGLLMLVPVVAFSFYLVSLGLEPLPSSTVVKKLRWDSQEMPFWTFWVLSVVAIFYNSSEKVNTTGAVLLLAPYFTLIGILVNWRQWRHPSWAVGLAMTGALVGHILFGRFSIWETPRYEFYLMAFVAPLGLYLLRRWLVRPWERRLAVAILFLSAMPALYSSTVDISMASRAIYLQQYQMNNLVRHYWDKGVAVNDIGLPGYRNPNFVLDLIGLADPQARQARFTSDDGWADRLVRARNIPLVMIYRSWWRQSIRKQWTPVGELFRDSRSTLGDRSVVFYTPYPDQVAAIQEKLRPWVRTLPAGAWFVEYSAANPPPAEPPEPQPK